MSEVNLWRLEVAVDYKIATVRSVKDVFGAIHAGVRFYTSRKVVLKVVSDKSGFDLVYFDQLRGDFYCENSAACICSLTKLSQFNDIISSRASQ